MTDAVELTWGEPLHPDAKPLLVKAQDLTSDEAGSSHGCE